MNKKYFFFDIDGTLLAGGVQGFIPDSTKKAIQILKEKGHFLAIATGRSQCMAYPYMQELGFENMVSDGGNGVTIDSKLFELEPLDRENCLQLIKECNAKEIPWAVSITNESIRFSPDQRFSELTQDNYIKTIVDTSFDIEKQERIYKVYVACTPDQEKGIETLKILPFARYHDEYLFVEPDDKSVGIRKIMHHFKADLKDVVVFGDGKNDLKMFLPEWTSIAMGNAIDELKNKSTFVTTSVDDDGIWHACSHFKWI